MSSDEKFFSTTSFRAAITDEAPDGVNESQYISRRAIISTIANAIDFARLSGRYVGLLMVELMRPDKLEAIVGTPTAEVMKHAIRRLPSALRPDDRMAAVTEDKIIILLPNLKSTAQAWLAAGKVQRSLEDEFSVNGEIVVVRPVVGIATFPDHAELPEELVVHADIAVGVAAQRDVSQHIFQSDDRGNSDAYLGLEAPLREAIRANRLELHYQPQVDCQSGRCNSAEALLRWNAPDVGAVSPATVIRIAEASGAISALTNWVMNAAFRQQSEWARQGVSVGISLNLSPVNLSDPELPDAIQQALGTWDTAPETVTFEITESTTIGDAEKSIAVLNRIKALGVKVALDDFGTGYSSLSYVKNFPLDELKIDRIFIQNMQHSVADMKIVRSVIDLAHSFNLHTVAEGVEDPAIVRDLRRLGCDAIQGYVHSPPLPPADFVRWLSANK
jgi:diguanylate cyclase